jgi:hypothetical protein
MPLAGGFAAGDAASRRDDPPAPRARGGEAELELAVDPRSTPQPAPTDGTLHAARFPWRAARRIALALCVAGLAAAAFLYRDRLLAIVGVAPGDGRAVYVLVETEPGEAEVYVDGVFQTTKPIALPRSDDRLFQLTVKARGYLTETREIKADATRAIRIKLRPAPRE